VLYGAPGVVPAAVGRVARPGLTVFNGLLYMAWRGIGGDVNIYWTSFDGARWNPSPVQHRLSDRGTFAAPALATYSSGQTTPNGTPPVDTMIMVWPGVPGDPCMYFSQFDPAQNDFSPQTHMNNAMHAVQQAAMQFYRPSDLLRGQVLSFRTGNETFCQANSSDSDITASLGAVDGWAPTSPPPRPSPAVGPPISVPSWRMLAGFRASRSDLDARVISAALGTPTGRSSATDTALPPHF
jgi:hypothetical protein